MRVASSTTQNILSLNRVEYEKSHLLNSYASVTLFFYYSSMPMKKISRILRIIETETE
jgi:hypothetical protein